MILSISTFFLCCYIVWTGYIQQVECPYYYGCSLSVFGLLIINVVVIVSINVVLLY